MGGIRWTVVECGEELLVMYEMIQEEWKWLMIVSNFEAVQLNKYCKEILLVVSKALSYSLIQRRPMLAPSPCHWANVVYGIQDSDYSVWTN